MKVYQFKYRHPMKMSLLAAVFTAGSSMVSNEVLAHGYVVSPQARAYACNTGANVNCGSIQWDPQSVEGPSGFPISGPEDGKIASGATFIGRALDEQSPTRWSKTDIKSGFNKFSWQLTANHITRNWRYYITRKDWDENKPLSRNSFALTPFCVVDEGMKQPPKFLTHDCNIPQDRSGYHVILAVWEIGDTSNSFYNVIDVNIGADTASTTNLIKWKDVGNINPSLSLKSGDKVMTRVFDSNGERSADQTLITIEDATQGAKENWPFILASAINSKGGGLKAGQKNTEGTITPVYGKNTMFSALDSEIERVEIAFDIAHVPVNSFEITELSDDYQILDGNAKIIFDVTTNSDMQISAYLSSHHGTAAGFVTQEVNNSHSSLSLDVVKPKAGHYHLQIKAESRDGEVTQKNYDLFLKEKGVAVNHDFVFPQKLTSYVAGTKVFQPKTGKVYECKPWPYNGYCVQWSVSANAFEPGVGHSWSSAWIEL